MLSAGQRYLWALEPPRLRTSAAYSELYAAINTGASTRSRTTANNQKIAELDRPCPCSSHVHAEFRAYCRCRIPAAGVTSKLAPSVASAILISPDHLRPGPRLWSRSLIICDSRALRSRPSSSQIFSLPEPAQCKSRFKILYFIYLMVARSS